MLALLFSVALRLAPDNDDVDVESRAETLVRLGQFDAAFDLLEQAYYGPRHFDPRLLFAMGVIDFRRDNCNGTVSFMGRYLATQPGERASTAAREYIQYCEEQTRARPPGDRGHAESTTSSSVATPPVADPVAQPPPRPAPPSTEDDGIPDGSGGTTRWYRDGLGWGLLGSGGAFVVAGAVLLVQGQGDLRAAESSMDEAMFDTNLNRATTLRMIGGMLTGVGASLAVGAAIHWIVVGRQPSPSAATVGWIVRPHAGGIRVRLHF